MLSSREIFGACPSYLEPGDALSSLLLERRKVGATSGRISIAHTGEMAVHWLPLIADAKVRRGLLLLVFSNGTSPEFPCP